MPLRLPSLSLEQCINETNPALLEQAEYLSLVVLHIVKFANCYKFMSFF